MIPYATFDVAICGAVLRMRGDDPQLRDCDERCDAVLRMRGDDPLSVVGGRDRRSCSPHARR